MSKKGVGQGLKEVSVTCGEKGSHTTDTRWIGPVVPSL